MSNVENVDPSLQLPKTDTADPNLEKDLKDIALLKLKISRTEQSDAS
jgi:hypothetical protein